MSDGQLTQKLFDLCDTLSRCHDKRLCHPDSNLRSSPHAGPWAKGDPSFLRTSHKDRRIFLKRPAPYSWDKGRRETGSELRVIPKHSVAHWTKQTLTVVRQ